MAELELSTKLAFERTRVAYDRTTMAWIRTATSLITLGFTLYKFFQFEKDVLPNVKNRWLSPRDFALIMVGAGLFSLLLGSIVVVHGAISWIDVVAGRPGVCGDGPRAIACITVKEVMSAKQKIVGELEELGMAFLYFALCFLVLLLMKKLFLAEYQVSFYGLSSALVGAFIVAKVVLLMEYVPLGGLVQKSPVIVDVVLRTLLYCFGVLGAIVLEHGFEQRHEHGGFGNAIAAVVQNRNFYHVWATTLGVGGTILVFNLFTALRLRFGSQNMIRLFLKMSLDQLEEFRTAADATAPIKP
jgi:uncharacterized membrane protein YidH (DUF202 family)